MRGCMPLWLIIKQIGLDSLWRCRDCAGRRRVAVLELLLDYFERLFHNQKQCIMAKEVTLTYDFLIARVVQCSRIWHSTIHYPSL